nr:hypothetical protein [Tanacetum cinerariifolium]
MDLSTFIHVVDPTKVKVVQSEYAEGERKLLESTVGHVVPLLPVASARFDSELEASVDKLFDEETKGDHGTSSGADTCGKSPSVFKELLASSIPNVKVGVEAVTTQPLVTSSVSTTPGREADSSHHSSTHASEAKVDSIIRFLVLPSVLTEVVVTSHVVSDPLISISEMGTKITSLVHASMFHDSDSTEIVRADVASPSYSAKQDLSMGSRELNTKNLHQVFVPQ